MPVIVMFSEAHAEVSTGFAMTQLQTSDMCFARCHLLLLLRTPNDCGSATCATIIVYAIKVGCGFAQEAWCTSTVTTRS